ncbi:MAG: FUN14 domain-containing protein [Halobacteriaceae archaeon]
MPAVLAQTLGTVDLQSLGLELGTGAVIGAVIGFAAKKVAKLVAVIIGIQLALFKFLESRGILQVNWEKLGAGFLSSADAAQGTAAPWLNTVLSTLSISAGFAGGFAVGFRKG